MALLRVAEHPILEALAILFLAIRFLAFAPAHVLRIYVLPIGALHCPWRASCLSHHLIPVSFLVLILGRTKVIPLFFLDLRQESHWISGLDTFPLLHNFRLVLFVIAAILAVAVLIAVAALGKALAIHLKALRLCALAS